HCDGPPAAGCGWGHSAVPLPGRPFALTIDEVYGTFTVSSFGWPWGWARLWNIAQPRRPHIIGQYKLLQNTSAYTPAPGENGFNSYSSHNPTVLRDLIFDSWHSGGEQAIDVSDPGSPVQAGWTVAHPGMRPVREGVPARSCAATPAGCLNEHGVADANARPTARRFIPEESLRKGVSLEASADSLPDLGHRDWQVAPRHSSRASSQRRRPRKTIAPSSNPAVAVAIASAASAVPVLSRAPCTAVTSRGTGNSSTWPRGNAK